MSFILEKPDLLAFLAVGVIAVYMIMTLRLIRRKPSLLWIPAVAVALSAVVLFWFAYGSSGAGNWLPRLVLSVVGALNLFLFNAISTFGNLHKYFYLTDGMMGSAELVQSRLILLESLLVCASWTTSILTVHLFARRFSSRLWLFFHRPAGKRRHVFLGDGRHELALAADLAKNPGNQILFVVFPTQDALPGKLSFLQMIRGVRPGTERLQRIRQEIPRAVILSARRNLKDCRGGNLFREIGLPALVRWAARESTSLYFLSDDESQNLAAVGMLPPCSCKIYCRADHSGVNDSIALVSEHDVRLVDEAFLTVKQMKMEPAFYPVRYVEKALDPDGNPLGWVQGGFRSMVLGFGDIGRGILSFLYEFGAFVGEDKEPAPFSCEVLDRDAAVLAGNFRREHPGIIPDKVRFTAMEIGSEDFWRHFDAALDSLNYVAIALGDDQQNIRLALDMLDLVCHREKYLRPAIVVKLDEPGKYRKLIDFYSQSLDRDCIRILGGLEAWKEANLVDETFERHASAFYGAYCKAAEEPVLWEDRIRKIESSDASPLWKKLEMRRKVGQDYSDYMHMKVKAELCPARLWQDPSVAGSIPAVYAGLHCTDPVAEPVLSYLAIGEHLRWQAAHEMEGYRYGPEKREDLKIHPALRDYLELSEQTRHYDWIVVKTSLQLLRQAK